MDILTKIRAQVALQPHIVTHLVQYHLLTFFVGKVCTLFELFELCNGKLKTEFQFTLVSASNILERIHQFENRFPLLS